MHERSATEVWRTTLQRVLTQGVEVAPRGQATKEILGHQVVVDMRKPVVRSIQRKLSYQFMAAEAYWICTGDNRLSELELYAPQMTRYSDDGVTLAGAYGPMIAVQFEYIIHTLLADHDTRQAALTLWRPNPPPSADIPCTLSIAFQLRRPPITSEEEGVQISQRPYQLHMHVTMRASDVWLGLPYDVFSFSMVGAYLCTHLHQRGLQVELGALYLTAASSHLYTKDCDGAQRCLQEMLIPQRLVPAWLLTVAPERFLWHLRDLREARSNDNSLRWWVL